MKLRRWPFFVSGRRQRTTPLPQLDVEIKLDFIQGSFVAPNAWYKARGRIAAGEEPLCGVRFGVSPLNDRIYVDGLWVEESLRRKGVASALLLAVVKHASPSGKALAVTPLQETYVGGLYWNAVRAGVIPGLVVTDYISVGQMQEEAKRWRAPPRTDAT